MYLSICICMNIYILVPRCKHKYVDRASATGRGELFVTLFCVFFL